MAASDGFDFTWHMRLLCQDMVARLAELQHIDMQRVAVGFAQSRGWSRSGLYASLTPLRFAGGQRYMVRRGKCWGMQRVVDASGREMLYILRFYLPRFMDLPFTEKLLTVMHELWHIGPNFDGDLRRFPGRRFAHGPSRSLFDVQSQQLVERWLATRPPESLYSFLKLRCHQLLQAYGSIFGEKYALPKLVPVQQADCQCTVGGGMPERDRVQTGAACPAECSAASASDERRAGEATALPQKRSLFNRRGRFQNIRIAQRAGEKCTL